MVALLSGVYRNSQRQAHLRREFIKISEHPGVSKELGTALVKLQEKLFELW